MAVNRKRKARKQQSNVLQTLSAALKVNWERVQWARLITLCTVLAVSLSVYVATLWMMNRPIQAVVINGAFERVSAIQVEDALGLYIQTGFLSADLHAMRRQLRELPWVANTMVRRRWPGTIEVSIEEQSPAARWGDAGLLNIDGELFIENISHAPVELPLLSGPKGTEQRVAEMFFRVEARLERRGLAAVSLQLDDRGAWEMQLTSGIRVRLGARMVETRLDRFFEALDKVVAAQAEDVDYIDMRYTNGFAIGWKNRAPMNAKSRDGVKPHV
ncbi:MAG: FtsQ-type POTRA domain-containing protein [Gammaproteobacteria bacterium]|jgi:cell division protein FtsQ|nr:FtsQ-type POTRA domain-containing protein [Gammaproteobacteria bacterium]